MNAETSEVTVPLVIEILTAKWSACNEWLDAHSADTGRRTERNQMMVQRAMMAGERNGYATALSYLRAIPQPSESDGGQT